MIFFLLQARYKKKFNLAEVKFEDFFGGPVPIFVKSQPKKLNKPKEKSSEGTIDLTGEDDIIKQKKKERKEQKQALKQKKTGLFK